MAVHDDFSAGGVVSTEDGGVVVFGTRFARGERAVGLPKRHPEPAKTSIDTALREVREETELEVEHRDAVREEIDYRFNSSAGDRVRRRVLFYPLQAKGGVTSAHDGEIGAVLVLSLAVALTTLTHEPQRDLVRAFSR